MCKLCRWNAHTGISMVYTCYEVKMAKQMRYYNRFKLKIVKIAMKNGNRVTRREYSQRKACSRLV